MSWFKPMPFFDAVRAGKVNDVRKHLEAGVDPNLGVDGGRAYPLHFAVHAGAEIVQLLIDHGAKTNVKSDDGRTPLHTAASEGYFDLVLVLIKAGAAVNATDSYGRRPLFAASHEVSAYDMLVAATHVVPREATNERSGRHTVVSVRKSHGAVPSAADMETAEAIGSVPEAERVNRDMALALQDGDLEYHRASSRDFNAVSLPARWPSVPSY